jgi:hypothetical protein
LKLKQAHGQHHMVMDLHLPLQIIAYQHYPYELHSYSWNGVLNTTLFDNYQDKTDRHDITDILLKVTLNTYSSQINVFFNYRS